MKRTIKYGALLAASALGVVVAPVSTAAATDGFVCPDGTDTIAVPYAFTPDGQPLLAGTVCVLTGTTRLSTLDISTGWTAKIKSNGAGNNARTDVRFTQTSTRQRVELIYEPGRTVIK